MPREGEGSRGDPWCPLKSLGPRRRDPGCDMRGTCTHAAWDLGRSGGAVKTSEPGQQPGQQPGQTGRRLDRQAPEQRQVRQPERRTLVSTRTEGDTCSGQRVPVRSADTCVWSLLTAVERPDSDWNERAANVSFS
jgi:hypothetical protein